MSIQASIEEKLRASLAPSVLEIINESGMHNVPQGSETHFKVVVVSAEFDGKSRVARHQLVFASLAHELRNGVHALSITARSPAEWAADMAVQPSPACLGGSKN